MKLPLSLPPTKHENNNPFVSLLAVFCNYNMAYLEGSKVKMNGFGADQQSEKTVCGPERRFTDGTFTY